MSAVRLASFTPGSDEWAQQRTRAIGGSEIAAILGLGKWESRFSLWHRKNGTISPQPDNPQMEWGRRLEAVVAGKYAEMHDDREIIDGGTFVHPERPWQLASPDRLIAPVRGSRDLPSTSILEIKTARDQDGWGEPGSDEIPVYYRAQAMWYMDVLHLYACDLAVLIRGSDYHEYRVTYDANEATMMRAAAKDFIDSLDNGDRPSIDEHAATYQAIRELHPEIEPVNVDLPASLARAYCESRHALKAAEGEAQRQRSLVADAMGSAQYATFAGQTIARRQAKGGGRPFIVAADDLPFNESSAA